MKKRTNPDLPEGLDGNVWERLVADLRGHMFAYGSWEKLAADSHLSMTTIQNLAYGNTRSPHFLTVVKILAALDRVDELVAVFRSDNPVSTTQAKKKKPKPKKRSRK